MPHPAAVLALFVLLVSPAARADVVWLCGLSDDALRLVCVADAEFAAGAEAPLEVRARVRGTAFPLDARRRYTVDLWAPATDTAFVEELAAATMCYRSPGCSVVFNAPARAGR